MGSTLQIRRDLGVGDGAALLYVGGDSVEECNGRVDWLKECGGRAGDGLFDSSRALQGVRATVKGEVAERDQLLSGA